MEDIVIIGGGVAGLSCLNALADRGIKALLLEGAQVGKPKMCGEFLAPAAVTALEQWEIGPLQTIKKVKFSAKQNTLSLDLPYQAAAFSRSKAELLLAARAQRLGCAIQENAKVMEIIPASITEPFTFRLADNTIIQSNFAIFASGKALTQQSMPLPYYGVKMTVPKIISADTLFMHSLPGAYMGVIAIENNRSNCAGLITRKAVEKHGNLKNWFTSLLETNVFFKELFEEVPTYLEAQAPHFGFKQTHNWPRALWIGDTIVNLPPAIGSGFAHSVISGILAAECYSQQNFSAYKNTVGNTKLFIGKLLHRLLLNPNCHFLLPMMRNRKLLTDYLFKVLYKD